MSDNSSTEEDILSNVSRSRLDDTRTKFFKNTLRENGIILNRDDRPPTLTKEQSLVIRDLEKALTKTDLDENVSKFVTGFKTCCKKDGLLHKFLQPTILRKNTIEDSLIHQESLLRIFFHVSCVQNELMEFILEEATEQLGRDDSEASDFRLILNSMKYLPFMQSASEATQKLLDMVEIGAFADQLEILNSIPEIIPDSQYESTAKELCKLLESQNELTSAIIDCLNSLNLSNETRVEIQQYILERLLSSVSIEVYPVLFDFLIADCKPISLPSVLQKCRDALNDLMRNESADKEKESKKVIVMNKLNMSVAFKTQYDGWMNFLVNIGNFNTTHKPIDIIIMAILHSTGNSRKRSVQALIKKHVKKNLLKRQHLETVFEKYFIKQFFHDYFSSLIEIASSLLKGPSDQLTTDFASAIFILLFENKSIDQIQRQDVLHTLILLTSGWETKNIGDILKILLELSKGNHLKQHTAQLMGLLEKVDTFELKDVKQVFELLCSLTCNDSNESISGLRDELHMLIRKQMSSAKRHLKQRGIIAAIIMAKHIAASSTQEDQSDGDGSEEFIPDISNLPEGAPQESAMLLELARNAASSIPELMGMYYDQLATMLVKAPNMDRHFKKWLKETVQQEFENIYTIKEIPEDIDGVPVYLQYCLNEEEELHDNVNINIAGLAMQPTHTNPIALLAPLFRMFRMLTDLEEIDALLGCGVVLPELEDITLYDAVQRKCVADSLFHCVNWFREIVSAFTRHPSRRLRMRLMNRIVDLVKLEEEFAKCLRQISDYKVPASYFYNILTTITKTSPVKTKSETKSGRPKKKLKTNTGDPIDFLNETVASTTFTATSQKKKSAVAASSAKRSHHQAAKPEFRELDTDLIILLKYPLDLAPNRGTNSPPNTTICLQAFRYVIADVVSKLDLIVKNKNLGMSNLNDVEPAKLIADCVKFAPKVFANFQEISKRIEELQVQNEDDNANLYSEEAKRLKDAFGLCLEYFLLLFSWKGYAKNLGLLRDCLRSLADEETPSQSILHFSRNVGNRFLGTADRCLLLGSAVSLVKIMDALYRRNTENGEIKKKITAVSGKFLNRKWYDADGDLDSGKSMNENLDTLIKAYLDGASVKTLSGIVGTLLKQAETLHTKGDYLEMMESINTKTFYILYRNLCHFTLERVKIEIASLTNKEHLTLWKTTTIIMQGLMTIAKLQNKKDSYTVFLQKSNGILKVFLTDGVPILEIMLKSKPDEVVEILKTLQTTTRFLHHLCCTSKLSKDASIMAHVPKFKETLETLMYRVKAALVANDCSEAFWMGNLKNKDLDGEEIVTQTSSITDSTESVAEDEEMLPLDEESDEEILGEQEEASIRSGDDRSASEIF